MSTQVYTYTNIDKHLNTPIRAYRHTHTHMHALSFPHIFSFFCLQLEIESRKMSEYALISVVQVQPPFSRKRILTRTKDGRISILDLGFYTPDKKQGTWGIKKKIHFESFIRVTGLLLHGRDKNYKSYPVSTK